MRLFLFAVLGTVVLAGCSSAPTSGSSQTASSSAEAPLGADQLMVDMVDDQFQDGNLTVGVGSSIMYMNGGQHQHTVTIHLASDPPTTLKHDQVLQPGGDTTYVFTEKGTYHVWCRFHGQMTSGMASVVTVR